MKLKFMRVSDIELAVCGMAELPRFTHQNITHLISIHDAGFQDDDTKSEVKGMFPNADIHFGFFNDTSDPQDPYAPQRGDVSRILEVLGKVTNACVLIHCAMGISRSTAFAYSALCRWTGPDSEVDCFNALMKARPFAVPNPLIVSIADELLVRGGAMIQAVNAKSHRSNPWFGQYF